jgi:hypothetical protein
MWLALNLGGSPNWRVGHFKYLEFILHLVQAAPEKSLSTRKGNLQPIMP